jgi:1-acyl-sn-glycerol-3-phosphate acyltransferase
VATPLPADHPVRASWSLARISLAAITWLPACLLARYLWPKHQPHLPRRFHNMLSRMMGISIDVVGTPATGESVLFVSNHWSWVDIPVLGARILASFVAKHEVSEMPVVGPLANLQRTIYVKREQRHRVDSQRDEIAQRLIDGDSVILFPEGTSGPGGHVLPFKTSLFGVTDTPGLEDLLIQPVTISYTHLNGFPLLRNQRYRIAWVGDIDFGPHAWAFLGLGKIRAQIVFHPAVRRSAFANRKLLAQHCHSAIEQGLRLANARRVDQLREAVTQKLQTAKAAA